MSTPAISFDSPLQQATTVNVPSAPAGVTFDQPLSSPVTLPSQGATQSSAPATPQSNEIKINPTDNLLTKAGKAVGGTFQGIGEGVFGTAAGASDLIDKATGMQPGAANSYLHTLAGDNETLHGTAQNVGRGAETLAEFVLGDEALKALPMSQRLLKASKAMQTIEESPVLNRIFQAGVRAVRGGTVGAAQGEVKSGGNTGDAASEGVSGAVGNAIVPEAFDAVKTGVKALPGAVDAIKKPFSLKAVQEALQGSKDSIQQALQSDLQGIQDSWHGSVRDLFDQVANDAGVQAKPAESLRDVAANTAAAVKAKASGLYKQLDQALGGTRFQTYDEQLNNVRRALRNSAGIDPDADGRLIERINDLEDAKSLAVDLAKASGVDPKIIDSANAAWRQGSALEDLSKHIQAATSGLRGDLAQGVQAAPEALSPAKLAPRANRLYSSGRLQQAIGAGRADDLLRAIETTKQQAQDAAENAVRQTEAAGSKAAQDTAGVKLRRYVAGAALAGVPGAALLRHLLGE